MKITQRLLLIICLALSGMIFIGGLSLWDQNRAQQRFDYLANDTFPDVKLLSQAKDAMADMRLVSYRHIVFADASAKLKVEEAAADADTRLSALFDVYEKHVQSDATARQMLEKERAELAASREVRQRYFALSRANDLNAARAMLTTDMARSSKALIDDLNANIDYNYALADRRITENQTAHAFGMRLLLTVVVLDLIVTGALALALFYHIRSSLTGLRGSMKTVSQSLDLTHVAHIERHDEIGDTAAAFNVLLKRVAETMAVVRHSSDAVGVASNQIAAGNMDLSARTEQQAASLEETAASMDELTEIVKHNAQNAREANVLVVDAAKIVQEGNDAVGEVVGTMARVSKSAEKITDIIGVIEDLGFQTNILALNAAVEAARAGESGRGFAVVASEVRNLAQRSSTSAKEIRALISASVQGVHEGATLAENAGATMTRAMHAVTRVNQIVAEIAQASEEQTQGIEQINLAVAQMDGVTQQNAALVEQCAAAAQSLAGQGQQLSEAVQAFRLQALHDRQAEPRTAQ